MASKIEISNIVLLSLGADPIESFDDGTVSSKAIAPIYEFIAEMVMAMGAWPSVKKRQTLAQLDETPEFGYTYVYQLPTNPKCLRVLEVNEASLGQIPWQIEADKLLSNESSIGIVYLAKLEDSEKYDIYLTQAIIAKLKATLAYKFTSQTNVAKDLITQMELELKGLLSKATSQGTSHRIPSDDYVNARSTVVTSRLQDDWNTQV